MEELATVRASGLQEWSGWDWNALKNMLREFYKHFKCDFNEHCQGSCLRGCKILHPDEFVMQQATRALFFIQSIHKHAPSCRRDFVYNVFLHFSASFNVAVKNFDVRQGEIGYLPLSIESEASMADADEWAALGLEFSVCPPRWHLLYRIE